VTDHQLRSVAVCDIVVPPDTTIPPEFGTVHQGRQAQRWDPDTNEWESCWILTVSTP
jgi:hypothetical protein